MPIIETDSLIPGLPHPKSQQIYAGLDACITLEVFQELCKLDGPGRNGQNEPIVSTAYSFERALQAPALEMMIRGFKVNEEERQESIRYCNEVLKNLREMLDEFATAVWDKPLNPRSHPQLKEFFYTHMRLPEIWISQKGVKKLSMNREALEKLRNYFHAQPIINLILLIRDFSKQLSVLETEVDPDGRMRTSYNIAGTECISGDSLVLTRSGLQRIDRLWAKQDCQVWDGENFYKPVRFVKYENQNGFLIELEGGITLKCSSNHPIMTARGFVPAEQLTIADYISLQVGCPALWGHSILPRITLSSYGNRSHSANIPSAMSKELCEFIGMFLADGSLLFKPGEHYRIILSNSDTAVQNRFVTLAETLFKVPASINGDVTNISSGQLVEWLIALGFIANGGLGTATRKFIPHAFMSAKAPMLRALLRGLTLDSHFTEKGIAYGTQSPEMQQQIQQALLSIGILSNIISCGDSTKLQVPRSYLGRFLSIVGFVQYDKAIKAAIFLNGLSQWHEPLAPGQRHFIPIKRIIPWSGDVYDVTMPVNAKPQYIANGMLVHNTLRWSSSASVEGTGTNLQNLNICPNYPKELELREGKLVYPVNGYFRDFNRRSIRKTFEADEGYELCGIDLEQAESRELGLLCGILFNDWSYLDACEGGDLHTLTAKLIWRDLPWTGDLKKDREIADQKFYRDFSYRDMSKRGGHGSNYFGTPWTMARHLKVPQRLMEDFQKAYFLAFPGIPLYHKWVASQLQTVQKLTTPWGVTRHFFGRPNDDSTLREAIAFSPQSSTAVRLNLALYRVWKELRDKVQILAQVHDALYFQYRPSDRDEVIPKALSLIKIEFSARQALINVVGEKEAQRLEKGNQGLDRIFSVPGEAKIGANWGNYHEIANPRGLKKWKLGSEDERVFWGQGRNI